MATVVGILTPATKDRRIELFDAILEERDRQDEKFGWKEAPGSIMPNGTDHERVSVLLEEVGEVARAVLEGDRAGLADELVQVAAVVFAWLEAEEDL